MENIKVKVGGGMGCFNLYNVVTISLVNNVYYVKFVFLRVL